MPVSKSPHSLNFPVGNRILAVLPPEEYARLLPHLSPVRLPQGKVLWAAGDPLRHAYFPSGGMLSLLSTTQDGHSVEAGMIGNEGVAGVAALLRMTTAPYEVVVQLPTSAVRIGVETLDREFRRGGRLQDLLLRYMHTLVTQIAQSVSCGCFHTTEERLARWLLICRDRVNSATINLTQEFLAQMIGVPRTSVTAVAGRLRRKGLIRYSRGKVEILNRGGLESYSCECYRVISDEISRYLAA